MAQTVAGAAKMKQTMIERLGGEEAYRQYVVERGRKGGLAKVPKGFALWDKKALREIGQKGGLVRAENYKTGNVKVRVG